jgi:hypothetical protein
VDRPTKITFGELRAQGCSGVVVYRSDCDRKENQDT